MMFFGFCSQSFELSPGYPKYDLSLSFATLSETMSIPITLTWETLPLGMNSNS